MSMKKMRIWVLLSVAGVITLFIFGVWQFEMNINSDFATEAFLNFYDESENRVSVTITDEYDILILKQILNGRSYRENTACGFTTSVSITMTDGRKSIVFCPAHDGCPLLRIGASGRYIRISDEANARLHEVLERYGMTFPL